MHGHRPHPVAAGHFVDPTFTDESHPKRGKKRGSYNCGRCRVPKKGHICPFVDAASPPADGDSSIVAITSPLSISKPPPQNRRKPYSSRRRALTYDDVDVQGSGDEDEFSELEFEPVMGSRRLPFNSFWNILSRLPPPSLMSAAVVCKGWRDTTRGVWKAAEELKLDVPAKAQIGFVGSVLKKCSGLLRLSLRMESDVDATMLACIAFSCPNLESVEILTLGSSINRITGDELGRFVADRRCLTSLKMEGCANLGAFNLCSSSLTTLWLSELHSLSKTVFNCPSLEEVSLHFSSQGNDSTDLAILVDNMGRSCRRLQNLHIASARLSHVVVLALTAANLSGLRRLSFVLGSEITDASVAAIASTYPNLELLDLSGSSISDSGVGMICNVFPGTLSNLLLALCPNVTSSGIQFATAQLPLLELLDCGMTICDPNCTDPVYEENNDHKLGKTTNTKTHLVHQKLFIKHGRLRKLSLWGCSGLDALNLSCPELDDLNLNSCRNLDPENLDLNCPSLKKVYASGCPDILVKTIQYKVSDESAAVRNHCLQMRFPDGSKRVRAPRFISDFQVTFPDKKRRRICTEPCSVIVAE